MTLLRVEAAEQAAETDIPESDDDALDLKLWHVMFPTVSWATRREKITELARARVQHALTGFLREYEAWKWENRKAIFKSLVLHVPIDIHPFSPTLDFGLKLSGPGPGRR